MVPLNATDSVGAEFLLLENRVAAGNDAEGQPGLFIWRITRRPDSGGFPHFELKLPRPADDMNAKPATRRVAWPTASARDFVIPRTADSVSAPVRNIQMSGDLVSFEPGLGER